MASPQSFLAAIVLAAVVAWLIWWSARRDARFLLQRDFAAQAEPPGPLTRCAVRFPLDEGASDCVVAATAAGWYMATPDEVVKNRGLTSTWYYLRTPVLIPWSRLTYGPAKFPAINQYRFDVTGTSIIFFVPRKVAEALLADHPR